MRLRSNILLIAICGLCSAVSAAPASEKRTSVVEGEIGQMSSLKNNPDYPDCYVIAQFRIRNIVSGPATPRTVNLAIPCFRNYRKTEYAALKKGMLIRAEIVSREHASAKEVATQQADDINDFTRETYFLREGKRISGYTRLPEPAFLDRKHYESTYNDPVNEPQSAASRKARAEQIEHDLAAIETAPRESSVPRDKLQKRWEKTRAGHPLFKPGVYWFQNGTGVFALPQNLSPYWDNDILNTLGTRSALEAICELNRFLKGKNVDLIIVLYPRIYPLAIRAMFPETSAIPIKENREIVRELLKNDVEAVDLAPEMVKLIPNSEFLLYYYHLNDHPGWETQDLAGRLLASRLERYGLEKNLNPGGFREKRVPARAWEGYVYPSGLPIGGNTPGEIIKTNCTVYDGAPVRSDPLSPVVTWGNSFLEWPKHWAFAAAIAKYSLSLPEIRHGSGCFTSMIKDLLVSPEFFLRGKKAFIMPVSVSMMLQYKFWNIRELDEMLMVAASARNARSVELPPETERREALAKFSIGEAESEGKAYLLNGKPLRIAIPAAGETKTRAKKYLRFNLVNNRVLEIAYGKTRKTLQNPAAFMWEAVCLPYDPQAGTVVLHSRYPDGAVLIKDFSIVETQQ